MIGFLKIIGYKPTELSVYKGRLKSKKQPAQPIFLAEPLTRTATPFSLPRERARERATRRKACIWAFRVLGEITEIRKCPLPSPPPRGRGRISADFTVAGGLKSSLDLPLISGRLKNKKAANTTCFPYRTLNPNSRPVLSPVGES